MFKFAKEQKIFDIGGIKVGGLPGQLPTVLMGSIFYQGHKIVEDQKKGLFDREMAEALLVAEEEESRRTGNSRIVDVVGSWPEAMVKYIDFVADMTETPLSLDCADSRVALAAIKHVDEVGLAGRVLLNSINPLTEPAVISAVKDAGVTSAILLALNTRMPTVSGRLAVLEGHDQGRGLLALAEAAGVENTLIDTTVLGIPDPGPVSKAIYLVKERYGLPAGCGAHNALGRWRERRELDKTTRLICNVAIHVMPITMGADFMLYGPISRAPVIYSACAMADAYVAYAMRQEYRVTPLTREHPLFKLFA
jgi:tetrahydromethanopterin S-methyltransferase subunit H